MKTADRILLYFIISVFALVAVAIIAVRVNTTAGSNGNAAANYSGNNITNRVFDFKNFNEVNIEGGWKADISKGDSYKVIIEMPEGAFDYLQVKQEGGRLDIRFNAGFNFNLFPESRNRIVITMPVLARFESSGSTKVTVSDFETGGLDLSLSGSSFITGTGNSIGVLNIAGSGDSTVDMKESRATNVHLDLSGKSRIFINMAGGDLTGKISGSSSVVYRGSLKMQNISQSGSVDIKHEP